MPAGGGPGGAPAFETVGPNGDASLATTSAVEPVCAAMAMVVAEPAMARVDSSTAPVVERD